MLTFFVRLAGFLFLARVAFWVLRSLGLIAPKRAPEVPSAAEPSRPGPAPGVGGDIVDAEFEDLPNPGER